MTRFTLHNPITAMFASAGVTATSIISAVIEHTTPILAFLTAFFACITGACIAALWVRKVWFARKRDRRRRSADGGARKAE